MHTKNAIRITKGVILCFMAVVFLNGCQDFSDKPIAEQKETLFFENQPSRHLNSESLVINDDLIAERQVIKNEHLDFIAPDQDGKFLPASISADELMTFTRQLTSALQGVLLDMENIDDNPMETMYSERPELFPYFNDKVIRYSIIDNVNMHIIVDICDEFGNEIFARDASFTPTRVDYVMPHR